MTGVHYAKVDCVFIFVLTWWRMSAEGRHGRTPEKPVQNTQKVQFLQWFEYWMSPPLVRPPEEECLLTSCKHCSFRESFFLQILAFNIQIQFIFQGEIRSGGYALAVQFHKSNIIFSYFLFKKKIGKEQQWQWQQWNKNYLYGFCIFGLFALFFTLED